jgi:hypothetical protein
MDNFSATSILTLSSVPSRVHSVIKHVKEKHLVKDLLLQKLSPHSVPKPQLQLNSPFLFNTFITFSKFDKKVRIFFYFHELQIKEIPA